MGNNNEMLITAFWIMLFGMAIVFIFLLTLIIAITLSHKILKFFKPADFIEKDEIIPSTGGNPKSIISAITAAVNQYRNKK